MRHEFAPVVVLFFGSVDDGIVIRCVLVSRCGDTLVAQELSICVSLCSNVGFQFSTTLEVQLPFPAISLTVVISSLLRPNLPKTFLLLSTSSGNIFST